MSTVRTSAPGKLVLCGEYVVLDGAAAVGVAVNRRSRASLHTVPDGVGTLRSPGYGRRSREFRYTDGRAEWRGDTGLPLVDAALERLRLDSGFGGELDTAAFQSPAMDRKLGLGSSASLAVSLTAALAILGGQRPDIVLADAVHRNFQGGSGSGLDVATCFTGGVVEFVRGGVARRLPWPTGLQFGVFWSGVPSSTTGKIGRYRSAGTRDESRRALADASAAVIAAFGSATDTMLALDAYARALRFLDSEHDIGIYGAGHGAVADASRGLPLVYKPCGAGGGDIGIAVSADAEAVEEFAHRVGDLGYSRLDLEIDNQGLVIEEWRP